MPSIMLSTFENLPPEALELLEAAGHTDIKSLFEHSYEEISHELVKANSVLQIVDGDLNDNRLPEWLKTIELLAGKELTRSQISPSITLTTQSPSKTSSPPSAQEPSTQQEIPQQNQVPLVSRLDLQQSPVAIPLSKDFTERNNLNLESLPQGIIRSVDNTSPSTIPEPAKQEGLVSQMNLSKANNPEPIQTSTPSAFFEKESTNAKPAPLDKSRILSMEEYQQEGSKVAQPAEPKQNNLTRTTKKETNEGVNPESKFFIKGVLHQDIPKFKIGSYAFLFFNLLILIIFAVTPLAVIDKENYWWCIFAPGLMLPAIFIYFTMCQKASCPICTQKQYALKRCLKHKNAHRWPIFGYMLPTCLHALFFKWFRCIFCGTSVRIKE